MPNNFTGWVVAGAGFAVGALIAGIVVKLVVPAARAS